MCGGSVRFEFMLCCAMPWGTEVGASVGFVLTGLRGAVVIGKGQQLE